MSPFAFLGAESSDRALLLLLQYCMPAAVREWQCNRGCNTHGIWSVCRRQDELFFVSERDGNMELYNRRMKNEMSSKHSYERMTSDPSMQVSAAISRHLLVHL